MLGQLVVQLATLATVSAGICVLFGPLRALGWKLFATGIVLAAAAAIIPARFG